MKRFIMKSAWKQGRNDGLKKGADAIRYAKDANYQRGVDYGRGLKIGSQRAKLLDKHPITGGITGALVEPLELGGKSKEFIKGHERGKNTYGKKDTAFPSGSGGGGGGESALFGSVLKFLWELPIFGSAIRFVAYMVIVMFVIGFLSYLAEEYLMPAVGNVLMRTKFEEKTYPETKKIRDFTKAIKSDPNNMEKYFSRGKAYFWDSFDTDQRTGERYKYFWITNNIKIKWKAKNQLGEAISDFTKVIEKNPKFAPAYYYRGWAYLQNGQYYEAITDITKAIELNPKYIEAYKRRAETYYQLGKHAEYERDSKKAHELKLEKEGIIKSSEKYTKNAGSENRNKVSDNATKVNAYLKFTNVRLLQSLDGGKTWNSLLYVGSMPVYGIASIESVVYSNQTLFVNLKGWVNESIETQDAGKTWELIVYCGSKRGTLRTQDKGKTWQKIDVEYQ